MSVCVREKDGLFHGPNNQDGCHRCPEQKGGRHRGRRRRQAVQVLPGASFRHSSNSELPQETSVPVAMAKVNLTPVQNVTSSSTVVASLEAARDKKSPVILQMSQGGAAYFAGKVLQAGSWTASSGRVPSS